jgi:hypothetical protein
MCQMYSRNVICVSKGDLEVAAGDVRCDRTQDIATVRKYCVILRVGMCISHQTWPKIAFNFRGTRHPEDPSESGCGTIYVFERGDLEVAVGGILCVGTTYVSRGGSHMFDKCFQNIKCESKGANEVAVGFV